MKNFYLKVALPAIISVLLFILTIFFIIFPQFEKNVLRGKREVIKEMTSSAMSLLNSYENEVKMGIIDTATAQELAIESIENLRYGDGMREYFWITDLEPRMVMHPVRKDLNGKSLTSFTDPNGKHLFVEMVNLVKKSNEGYIDYYWQYHSDSTRQVEKLSFVKVFKPWGWVVGSGIIIEDVKTEAANFIRKIIWISLIIIFIIAINLFLFIKRSLRIERLRIEAENELSQSKEKLRSLVEASTEGLVMVANGKISFANEMFARMTGFDPNNLIDINLAQILSENNDDNTLKIFNEPQIKDGRYELIINKRFGGFLEVLITSSTTQLYGTTVNILIITNLSADKNSQDCSIDYKKLMSTIDSGVFKLKNDTRGKLSFTDENVAKIMGLTENEDLNEFNFFNLFAESEEQKEVKRLVNSGNTLKNKVVKIIKPNHEQTFALISLLPTIGQDGNIEGYEGIITDITRNENEKAHLNFLISKFKTSQHLLEESVKPHLNPIMTMDFEVSLGELSERIHRKNIDFVLLTKNQTEYIGIITDRDILKRLIRLNLHPDNPAYLIMSAPILSITDNTTVNNALRICTERNINHLLVKDEMGKAVGVFKTTDVYRSVLNSDSFLMNDVRNAQTLNDLKRSYGYLQNLITPLANAETSFQIVSRVISNFSDAVIEKIIQMAIEEIGQPPVKFSFICLGSEGRMEGTLLTDQDNAIIFEDIADKEKHELAQKYFLDFAKIVNHGLNYVGYSFCKGNIMAMNPSWCLNLSSWKKKFVGWIRNPEQQNLLDASIFFDLRNIHGEQVMVESLRKTIADSIIENHNFLYLMATNAFLTKIPDLGSSGILSNNRSSDYIDLKAVVVPIIMLARIYSLKYQILETNTISRLSVLKDKGLLPKETIDEMLLAYNFAMKLRMKNQIELLEKFATPTNLLNHKQLTELELSILKRVISSVPVFQNRIKNDFRIVT